MLLLLGVTYQIRGRLKKSMKMLRSEGGAPSQEILGSLHQKNDQPFRVRVRALTRLATQFE